MGIRRISSYGLNILKTLEGFSPHLYDDGGKGHGHCTIGFGHLVHYDPCDSEKYTSERPYNHGITQRRAASLLREDVGFAQKAVNELVKVPLNQNQFDALVIFIYNVGRNAFAHSNLLKILNRGDFQLVPNELRKWNKSGGRVVPGLIFRRNKEIILFNRGML